MAYNFELLLKQVGRNCGATQTLLEKGLMDESLMLPEGKKDFERRPTTGVVG
jgi:hypothetical protein